MPRPVQALLTILLLAAAGCLQSAEEVAQDPLVLLPVREEPPALDPTFAVQVSPQPPLARDSTTFKLIVENATAEQVLWDFGDGTSRQGIQVSHIYRVAGQYSVKATVETEEHGLHTVGEAIVVHKPSGEPPGAAHAEAENTTNTEPVENQTTPLHQVQLPTDAPENIVQLYDTLQEAMRLDSPLSVDAYDMQSIIPGWASWGDKETFQVRLQPSKILAEDAFVEVDGTPVGRPFVEVYEGHVEGASDDLVRLVVSGYWARGSIRSGDELYLIRVNFDENTPRYPDGRGRPMPPSSNVEPHSSEPENCPGGLESWAPLSATSAPFYEEGRSDLDPITADIIMDGDAVLVETLGLDAFATMVAMVAEMESIYDYEASIRFQVTGLHLNTDPAWYANIEDRSPHDQMGTYWDTYHRDERDIVHLITGQHTSYAQANCIGGAGHTAGYTFTPYPWETKYDVFHTNAFAHELGHIFAAHHHYGNHVEGPQATIMIMGYTPGDIPNFSSLSKMVIRGWAEENL